jgi:Family of unknown function (DUF5320)
MTDPLARNSNQWSEKVVMRMPRGDGTGPPWGGGPGSGRGAGRCFGPRNSNSSKIGGGRVGRYVAFIEMLVPLASTLVALFKKSKVPKSNMSALSRVGVEADDSKNLKRGDEYAER